jgi:hypothetical protein
MFGWFRGERGTYAALVLQLVDARACWIRISRLVSKLARAVSSGLQLAVLAIFSTQDVGQLECGRVEFEGAVLLEDGPQLGEDALTDEHVIAEP